jgi:hypothetical protein
LTQFFPHGNGSRGNTRNIWIASSKAADGSKLMRRILLFVFSIGVLSGGAYVLSLCFIHPTIYGIARGVLGAGFLMFVGGYLLWEDFIKPLLGRRGKVS